MKLNNFYQYSKLYEAAKQLKMYIPDDILQLHQVFKANHKKLYVVGGAVRDVLMGKTPKDYDLATDATPEEVFRITYDYEHVRDGSEKHGVAKVIIPSEPGGIEIATFRKESYSENTLTNFITYIKKIKPENYISQIKKMMNDLSE